MGAGCAAEPPDLAEEVDRLRKLVYVPGAWRCPKCEFTLVQVNLNALDGSVTARDEAGDKCPNCHGPLWRTTWRDEATEMSKRAEEQMLRACESEADKARLDFLDRCNATLNARYGTTYRWRLVLNHNVTRLMLGHGDVDLHDSDGSRTAHPSCREAIDERILERDRARTARTSGGIDV